MISAIESADNEKTTARNHYPILLHMNLFLYCFPTFADGFIASYLEIDNSENE